MNAKRIKDDFGTRYKSSLFSTDGFALNFCLKTKLDNTNQPDKTLNEFCDFAMVELLRWKTTKPQCKVNSKQLMERYNIGCVKMVDCYHQRINQLF